VEVFEGLDLRKEVLFGVCCPEDNYFVCFIFHISNILPQFINNFLISTQKNVVGPISLVGRDEITVQGCREGHDGLELGLELLEQIWLKHLGALASVVEVDLGDVPPTDYDISGLDHGKNFFNRLVHVLKVTGDLFELEPDMSGSTLSEGTVEVRMLNAILGLPGYLLLVSEEARDQGRAVVPANADKHHAEFRDLLFSGNFVLLGNILE